MRSLRLSSSYYIVGLQGDGLLSLDPHHSRPAAPLRPFVGEPPSVPRAPTSHDAGTLFRTRRRTCAAR
ncbi:hypothetical protein DFH08DRAFT_897158 [Mycena albidolilacea]|uniref:Cysteine protease n=1 Tax=Mycena albidolilacea TaxID=1033008 RepID=A0AAD6Z8C1_9AGAR|nr:hypothetical protein DFH08DRAFT_897158 [Mycena albidolilacea]